MRTCKNIGTSSMNCRYWYFKWADTVCNRDHVQCVLPEKISYLDCQMISSFKWNLGYVCDLWSGGQKTPSYSTKLINISNEDMIFLSANSVLLQDDENCLVLVVESWIVNVVVKSVSVLVLVEFLILNTSLPPVQFVAIARGRFTLWKR